MIYRYSSRRKRLDQSFLNEKLKGAQGYDRIAGYFNSSILEVAGEAIEQMEGCARVVCNSAITKDDVITATAAANAMRREWCSQKPEEIYSDVPNRLKKLYDLTRSEKLQIKVLPEDVFGLIHGKAGVITLKDGSRTSFIGSVNETYKGWKLNYEILWEDDSQEAVDWVQEEFDYFWNNSFAVPLCDFVIEDIKRISERRVIYTVKEWKEKPEPASTVIESPVYRQEYGLWEHQKFFANLAFNDHKKSHGARYVLADTVGLGKTIQLALAAQLMALHGDKPILIIAPKTLLWQWQDEMNNLLDMPSAVWTGKEWVDENGIRYPGSGDISDIKKCPRRVGIVSQGLMIHGSETVQPLLNMEYECIIVDEAHRARRRNLGQGTENQKPDPNNLLKFLLEISRRTKSMLLATATPVQLYPIEAWDLLNILSQGNDSVLGNEFSMWRKNPGRALNLVTQKETIEPEDPENWEWVRNPFPPTSEGENTFGRIREQLNMSDEEFVIRREAIEELTEPDRRRVQRIIEDNFYTEHNPFIRQIVRRNREFLENTINPETGEPYLKAVKVRLFGESEDEAIVLPPYLQEAYEHAEEFCNLLQKRVSGGGFMKTLLLRRVGSSMVAGRKTAENILSSWGGTVEGEDYEEEEVAYEPAVQSEIKNISDEERDCLVKFIETLDANKEKDPKYNLVRRLLIEDRWIDRGCIIFSQYYDSAIWVAENLSADLPSEKIGVYAGGDKSGLMLNGVYHRKTKEEIKKMVKDREIAVLVGTDAASEGLNLQTMGSLINLDLPWNPTRLEQRKGRIQRIGQIYDEVYIYNMRYKGSVEDRVHDLLSERFGHIYGMFGQIPDVLEDVWIDAALGQIEDAKKKIDAVPPTHPFDLRYHKNVGTVNWESCAEVLDSTEKRKHLMTGWNTR